MSQLRTVFYAQIPWIICLFLLLPGSVAAYDQDEHPILGAYTLRVLENDGYGRIVQAMQAIDPEGSSLESWFLLGEHDADRLDLSRNHYYDPTTGQGLAGFESSAQLCKELFDSAVIKWRNGDGPTAMYLLGRTVHLLQDATMPHHVHLDPLNGHSAFETWLVNHTADYSIASGGIYALAEPESFVHLTALQVYGLYEKVISSNSSEANFQEVGAFIEPLGIRMSAGLLWNFFEEVDGFSPTLLVAHATSSTVTLTWTPSADSNFVRYDLYVSDVGKELVLDEEHKASSSGYRECSGANVTGLRSYGTYQFQVVTVLDNGTLQSNIVEQKLGITLIAVALVMGMMLAIVAVVIIGMNRRK